MQLSPLQSRLAASLAASLFVLAIYLLLFSPNLALAAELPLQVDSFIDISLDGEIGLQPSYEPEFALFDRSILGRQTTEPQPIDNNKHAASNLNPEQVICYVFEKSTIFGDGSSNGARAVGLDINKHGDDESRSIRRQDESAKTVYISANTCLQPYALDVDKAGSLPPQLKLYITTDSKTGCPDPSKENSKVEVKEFDEGAIQYSANVTDSVYITVAAPKLSSEFGSIYNFQLAASVDAYYHNYNTSDDAELLWMDSDSNSALLVSKDLTDDKSETDKIMDGKLPYSIYVENKEWPLAAGLQHSACGLGNMAEIFANQNGDSSLNHIAKTHLTTRGKSSLPKQQFFLDGLNASTTYSGYLVKNSNSSSTTKRADDGVVGGGGTVFKPTTFETHSSGNCQLIHDLDFCSDIQYTTPGDESRFTTDQLSKLYDNYAKKMYANFEKVMMQIPCEAGSTSRYSLARDCDNCKDAYKQWLCLVTIPRCEDYDTDSQYAIIRNIGGSFPNGTKLPADEREPLEKNRFNNNSRNSWIDETIQPGPYKEIMPCDDICYNVVQSCPAAIGFTCPQPHMTAFDVSYGRRRENSTTSCNYPGEARTPTSMGAIVVPHMALLGAVGLMVVGLLLS